MAIDLGDLKQHQNPRGMRFKWDGEEYVAEPTVAQGLAFQVAAHERDQKMATIQAKMGAEGVSDEEAVRLSEELQNLITFGTAQVVAPLFGSTFVMPEGDTPARFEGGQLEKLVEAGIDWGTLDKLIIAMWTTMLEGEDVAEAYMQTGKLATARELVAKKSTKTRRK